MTDFLYKLENPTNQPVNNIGPPAQHGAKFLLRRHNAQGDSFYRVDNQGALHGLPDNELLQGYGHTGIPQNIKDQIAQVEQYRQANPTPPGAQAGPAPANIAALEQSIAAWQDQYRQDWRSNNPNYNPDDAANYNPINPNQNPTLETIQQQLQAIQANLGANPNNPNALGQILTQVGNLVTAVADLTQNIQQLLQQQANGNGNTQNGADQDQEPAEASAEQREVEAAAANLETRRRELAQIVVRRKTRSLEWLTPGARRDKRDYQHARQLYDDAKARFMAAKYRLSEAEAADNGNTVDQDELARDMMLQSYEEQTAFINEEFSVVDQLRSNDGRWGRLLNRWAKVSTGKKIAIGLLVGGISGVALASGGLGLGVFGLAAGSAARFSLGIFSNRASTRNVSEHTRHNMREEVARRRRAAERSLQNVANIDHHSDQLIREGRRHETSAISRAQWHQRIGAFILAVSAIPFLRNIGYVTEKLPGHWNPRELTGRLPDINLPNSVAGWRHLFGYDSVVHHATNTHHAANAHHARTIHHGRHASTGSVTSSGGPDYWGPDGAVASQAHNSANNAGNYSYPWNWGVHEVGAAKAETWLHELSERAKEAGHKVQWHQSYLPSGQRTEWVSIDGNSKANHVIKVLNQYRK